MAQESTIVSIRLILNERMLLALLSIGGIGCLFTALLTYLLADKIVTVISSLVFGITLTVMSMYFYLVCSRKGLYDTQLISNQNEEEEDLLSVMKVT